MRFLATLLSLSLSISLSLSVSNNANALNKFGGNTPISAYTPHSIKTTLSPHLSSSASIVLPDDSEYEELTTKYSDYNRPTYSTVVAVASIEDVVATVKYAREHNIPFLVQSGGHSLTTSTQVTQNAIQINMRRLNYVRFDGERGPEYAVVGGGTLTGEFANATHAQKREVTVGSCPCTGVMGIGLGAGIGRLQGMYGYFMDNIVELTLVLYDGSVVTVSETSNTDLWWAARGAGHNFGVAVEAVIKTHPQLNAGKHFVADMEFPVSRTAELFQLLNEMSTPDLPAELAFFITAHYRGKSGKPIINVDFVWHGPREAALPYLQPFLDLFPIFKKEEYVPWDSLPWVTYLELNNILCSKPGGQRNFYAANAATYDISAMVSLFEDWEKTSTEYAGRATLLLMFQTFGQGKVQAADADSSVFPWRDGAKHFLIVQATYKDLSLRTTLDRWLKAAQNLIVESSGYGRLQQYVNYGHGFDDSAESLYGYDGRRIARLLELKDKYDPEGWFDTYQPVRRSPGGGLREASTLPKPPRASRKMEEKEAVKEDVKHSDHSEL